jgi:hypothetical protein
MTLPPHPVFLPKSAESPENKRVEFLASAKTCKRVRNRMKKKNLSNVASSHRRNCTVPEWEEYPHTPGVFVRVRNKGDKSGQRTCLEVRPESTISVARGS